MGRLVSVAIFMVLCGFMLVKVYTTSVQEEPTINECGNFNYAFFRGPMTFSVAKTTCAQRGDQWTMAMPRTEQENMCVYNTTTKYTQSRDVGVWLGFFRNYLDPYQAIDGRLLGAMFWDTESYSPRLNWYQTGAVMFGNARYPWLWIDNYHYELVKNFVVCQKSVSYSYWYSWQPWSGCSVSCGPALKARTRRCRTVRGAMCEGSNRETKRCQVPSCRKAESTMAKPRTAELTSGVKGYSVTLQWSVPSPLPDDLVYYTLEYRQNLGASQFGKWVEAVTNLSPITGFYTFTVDGGSYKYRVLARYVNRESTLDEGQFVAGPAESGCSVVGNDVNVSSMDDYARAHLGAHGYRQFIMVDLSPKIINCTRRIAAWEIRYSGTCSLRMQVWKSVGGQSLEYQLVGQNNASLPTTNSETVSHIYIISSQQILLKANSPFFLGITSTDNRCLIIDLDGADVLLYMFSFSANGVELEIEAGDKVIFPYRQQHRYPAFRAILQPVTCDERIQVTNGVVSGGGNTFESRKQISCYHGFKLNGPKESQCLANGQWSITAFNCIPLSCDERIQVSNGVASGGKSTYNSRQEVTCNPGFRLDGPKVTLCQANEQWSMKSFNCAPVDCGAPVVRKHSRVTAIKTTFLSKAEYTCDRGYELRGARHVTCNAKCKVRKFSKGTQCSEWEGKWSNLPPTCTAVTCRGRIQVTNGVASGGRNTFESRQEITCNHGFWSRGLKVTLCQANGQWSITSFNCTPVDCGAPAVRGHSRVAASKTTFLSKAEYTCDRGYELEGVQVITCHAKCVVGKTTGASCSEWRGKWSHSPPTCTGSSQLHLLPKGSHEGFHRTSLSAPPSQVTINSTPGAASHFLAQFVDHSTSAQSTFTDKTQINVPAKPTLASTGSMPAPDCGRPLVHSPAKVTFNSTTLQSKAVYTCEQGYALVGEEETQCVTNCTADNTNCSQSLVQSVHWSAEAPQCLPYEQVTKLGNIVAVPQTASSSLPCTWEYEKINRDMEKKFPLANGSLLILNVTIEDDGVYRCQLTSLTNKTRSVPFHLRVVVNPTVTAEQELTVSSRTNVSITCNTTGHPRPLVKWERLSAAGTLQLTLNPVLHLQNVTVNASGTYQCTAANAGGSVSVTSTLLVQDCPAENGHLSRIVNGDLVRTAQWQVLIWKKPSGSSQGRVLCGGALIKKRFVLTAAHCVINEFFKTVQDFIDGVLVKVGKVKVFVLEEFEQTRSVDRVRLHPNFKPVSLHNDIALLRLQRGVHLNKANRQHVSLISLPTNDTYTCFDRPGTDLVVTGYGLTSSFPQIVSDSLRYVRMPLTDISRCKQRYGNHAVTDAMLCSGDSLGRADSCRGDSGGPAVTFNSATGKWQLVGLTSWGSRHCGQHGSYAVLTRVSVFIDWIHTSVQHERMISPETCSCSCP